MISWQLVCECERLVTATESLRCVAFPWGDSQRWGGTRRIRSCVERLKPMSGPMMSAMYQMRRFWNLPHVPM